MAVEESSCLLKWGWVDHRIYLDFSEKRRIPWPRRDPKPGLFSSQPRQSTNYAIPAAIYMCNFHLFWIYILIHAWFLDDTSTFVNTERFIHKLEKILENTFRHIKYKLSDKCYSLYVKVEIYIMWITAVHIIKDIYVFNYFVRVYTYKELGRITLGTSSKVKKKG
jgi:hypothetical protein